MKKVIIAVIGCIALLVTESNAAWEYIETPTNLGNGSDYFLGISLEQGRSGAWIVSWKSEDKNFLGKIYLTNNVPALQKIETPNTSQNISASTRNIVLELSETDGIKFRVYDYGFNVISPDIKPSSVYSGNAYTNIDNELVVLYTMKNGGNSYGQKIDFNGNPILGTTLIGDYPFGYSDLWFSKSGYYQSPFLLDPCADDLWAEGCPVNPVTYLMVLDSNFQTLSGSINVNTLAGTDSLVTIAPEKDGDILAFWKEETLYCDPELGILSCWPIEREQWLLRLDELGAPKGVPVMFGMDEGDYWEGEFVTNPQGGFALVDNDEIHFFDGDGNIIQEDIPVNRDASYTQFVSAAFDKSGRFLIAFWADESNRFWGRVFKFVNCAKGQNVVYEDSGVKLTFDEITDSGYTEVNVTEFGPEPDKFRMIAPPAYYYIATTATFTGEVEVCVAYDETQLSQNEKLIRLFQWDGKWEDVTTSRDAKNNVVCGRVDSLISSPFAVGIKGQSAGGGCRAASDGSSCSPINAIALLAPLFVIIILRRIRAVKFR